MSDTRTSLTWPRDVLQVPVAATADEARREMLRRLDDHSLLPPNDVYAAMHTERGEPVAETMCWAAEERTLRRQLQEFRQEFFDVPPEERAERWADLQQRAREFPVLREQVERLSAGLTVQRPAADSGLGELSRLERWLCEVFLLSPAEQAAFRRRCALEIADNSAGWQAAARKLQKQRPHVAALDGPWIEDLTVAVKRQNQRRRQRKPKRQSQTSSGSSSWMLVVIAILMLRGIASSFNNSPRPTFRPPPTGIQPLSELPSDEYLEFLDRLQNVPRTTESDEAARAEDFEVPPIAMSDWPRLAGMRDGETDHIGSLPFQVVRRDDTWEFQFASRSLLETFQNLRQLKEQGESISESPLYLENKRAFDLYLRLRSEMIEFGGVRNVSEQVVDRLDLPRVPADLAPPVEPPADSPITPGPPTLPGPRPE